MKQDNVSTAAPSRSTSTSGGFTWTAADKP
jgi:hypothetical protein